MVAVLLLAVLPTGRSHAAGPAARTVDDSCPEGQVTEDGFDDVSDDNPHEAAIDCVVWWQIAQGTSQSTYQPGGTVSRAQMAAFLARLILQSDGSLPSEPADHFTDDDGNPHEHNINQLAEAGLAAGTGNRRYQPAGTVTRAQMATFLVQATAHRTGQPLTSSTNYFTDDDGNPHEDNINKAAQAGFTGGRTETSYDPQGAVRRDQMASFLARVLDLLVEQGIAPPMSFALVSILNIDADPPGPDLAHDGGEHLTLENTSDQKIDLQGWYLLDDVNDRIDFQSSLSIEPGAQLRVHAGTGQDGPAQHFLDRKRSFLDNDNEHLRLFSPTDGLADEFTYSLQTEGSNVAYRFDGATVPPDDERLIREATTEVSNFLQERLGRPVAGNMFVSGDDNWILMEWADFFSRSYDSNVNLAPPGSAWPDLAILVLQSPWTSLSTSRKAGVVHHEWAHVEQWRKAGLDADTLRSMSGFDGSIYAGVWLLEGEAIYVEKRLAFPDNDDFERHRQDVIQGTKGSSTDLMDLETYEGFRSAEDATDIAFLAVDYLVRNISGYPLMAHWQHLSDPPDWREAFKAGFGRSVSDFYQEFESYHQ